MNKYVFSIQVILIIFCFAFCINNASAQLNSIDSLKSIIKDNKSSGGHILSAYLKLAKYYDTINKEMSLTYALDMLGIADSLGQAEQEVEALDVIIKIYDGRSDFEHCAAYCKKAIQISKELAKELDVAYFSGILGNTDIQNGNYFEALENFNLAIELTRKNNRKYSEAAFLNNVGAIYHYLGDDFKALEYFLQSYQIKEANDFIESLAPSLINIGGYYNKLGKLGKALEYHKKALSFAIKNENYYYQVKALISLGEDYDKSDSIQLALTYYLKALDVSDKINDLTTTSNILGKLGSANFKSDNIPKALEFSNKALMLSDSIGYRYGISTFSLSLGEIYSTLGQYKESRKYLEKSLRISKEISAVENILDNYQSLSELYKHLDNYQKSLQYYVLYVAIKDSIFSKESKEKYSVIQTRYEIEKKQYELDLLKQENNINELKFTKTRVVMYGLSGLFLIFIALAILFFRQSKIRNLQKTIRLEQRLLRSQINPHFIFNTLTAVQRFIIEKSTTLASDYLGRFALLIRFILNNSTVERIALVDEVKFLENYLKLQALRFDDKFGYEITIGNGIDAENMFIPPMLVQPFIENAIEHGVKLLDKKGMIRVRFNRKGEYITAEIEDNGIGREKARQFNAHSLPGHKSMATNITKERLLYLNRKTDKNIKFKIIDLFDEQGNPSGTKVQLTVKVYNG